MFTHSGCARQGAAWILGLALVIALGVTQVKAQSGVAAAATLLGSVTDSSGAVVPGANVQVKNTGTGVTQSVTTDSQGRYNVPLLPIGEYQVQVTASGFQTSIHSGITLTVGNEVVVDFSLQVGQTQQSVTVAGEVTQVNTTSATVGSLVDQTQMRQLPLNGRDFEQLITLAPGVQSYPIATESAYQGRAAAYSVSGARPDGQLLALDGQNLQNFWNRGVSSIIGTSLGVEAIAEFDMLTNTYGAQFGGSGSVMNAASKGGTNSFHGSAFDFLRNSALDARNFFDPATIPAFRRNQFGGSIGGPVKRNKLFFFADYEGIRQALGETKIAFVPDANAHKGLLPTGPGGSLVNVGIAPGVASTLALYPIPTTETGGGIGSIDEVATQPGGEDYTLDRIDYTISSKDSGFGRYIFDKSHLFDPFDGSNLPLWPENDNSLNQFFTLQEKHIFSSGLLNSVWFNFGRVNSAAVSPDTTSALQFFPGRSNGIVGVSGLSSIGPNSFDPFYLIQNHVETGDDVVWTHGAHTLAIGGSIARFDSNTLFGYQNGGDWSFNGLTQFLQGNAASVTAPLPGQTNSIRDYREIDFALYAQDDWKVTSRLTLNLGLRWEPTTNPVEAHNNLYWIPPTGSGPVQIPHVTQSNLSFGNLDPRIGIAYDPFGNQKTSIRAGFGIFHEVLTPAVYGAGFNTAYPTETGQQINAVYPTPFSSAVSPTLPASNGGIDYTNSVTPYLIEYNLTVQQAIVSNTVLSVGYVGSHDVHEYVYNDQNPIVPTINSAGVQQFATLVSGKITNNPRQNTKLGSLALIIPTTSATYNSLQASLNRRFANNLQAQINYTFSKCIDDGEFHVTLAPNTADTSYSNPYNQRIDRGLCGVNYTHRLTGNAVYTLPFYKDRLIGGWQLSLIQTYNSGFPVTVTDGFSQSGLSSNIRPNLISAGCDQVLGSVAHWYNASCYAVQAVGTIGNLGKATVTGPGLTETDFAILKDTKISKISEAFDIQFRAELFNIFNQANFGVPTLGAFSQGSNGTGTVNSNAGTITSTATTSRQIQFALKFLF